MIAISEGKQAEVRVLDELIAEPGAIFVMDRSCVDFARLYRFVLSGAFFVTRTERGRSSAGWSRGRSIEARVFAGDHVVWLRNLQSARHYPDRLRRVACRDPEGGKILVFLTNNFDSPPALIAQLYKLRWRVELCFK